MQQRIDLLEADNDLPSRSYIGGNDVVHKGLIGLLAEALVRDATFRPRRRY
jgi:hypothetical protein